MAKQKKPQRRVKPTSQAPARAKPAKVSVSSIESEIKRTDKELVKLASRRAALTQRYISAQENPGKSVFVPVAEEALSELIERHNPGPLPGPVLRSMFREIVAGARNTVKTLRVAYLGPSYSFTHIAALERFGSMGTFIPVSSIAAVFEEVNRGHADLGIAPIENSTDGRVVDTLDMFTRLPLKICGEVQLVIHHNLLSRSPRSEITEIYSKPQALSQCREWLSRNMPQARQIEVTSTSTAAQLARDKPGAAAVASRQAGAHYELQIVAANIEDNPANITRFAIIGDDNTRPSGSDKTAVVVQIPHEPGSLSEALSAFRRNGINLTWIESFPLRGPEAGYLFFLDFEGHSSEPRVKKALTELEKRAVRLEILGSYPRSRPIE
jgi:chorismate mutase/prephenate dehydratase